MKILSKIKIVSGGQTGADRAALDFAKKNSIKYGGWCPKGGWAEDFPNSPGLLKYHKNMKETPLEKPEQRTEWNVRDSDATLIISDESLGLNSNGTILTKKIAMELNKPVMIANVYDKQIIENITSWLKRSKNISILNIAGPRESESPGLYSKTLEILNKIFITQS